MLAYTSQHCLPPCYERRNFPKKRWQQSTLKAAMKQTLHPTLEDLSMECVLMQAWKKTSAYLHYHSWYADTLWLDIQSLRIPEFIREIQERLNEPDSLTASPLNMVPAPKSQRWAYVNNEWTPQETKIEEKLRPLAHVNLYDQVIATAMMLCLADRVETRLGDPRVPLDNINSRKGTLAYGHRLFCDNESGGSLRHRWGSSKLYRSFFQDYQVFLGRPKIVAKEIRAQSENQESEIEIAVVQSDLSKFYDRVRPTFLHRKLRLLKSGDEEEPFFRLAERLLNWRWSDDTRARRYAAAHGIPQFQEIALPQGLVASGFFANIALLDFDAALKALIGSTVDDQQHIVLHDACFYVDDFRLVLAFSKELSLDENALEDIVTEKLQSLLAETTQGLEVSREKTEATIEGRDKRFLVKQSREARRIQAQVSGTFDMLHGTELIGAIEGFFHTQQRYSASAEKEGDGLLVGVPDMADGTAARFAAGKFRRTFRSLRPLIADETEKSQLSPGSEKNDEDAIPQVGLVLTKSQLDERGKFFSALLIEEWIRNPGNVRLLRIALDIYPDREFLEEVLKLLRAGWESQRYRKAKREVRLYCLAELFRAGATETGLVPLNEADSLPANVFFGRIPRTAPSRSSRNICGVCFQEFFFNSLPVVSNATSVPVFGRPQSRSSGGSRDERSRWKRHASLLVAFEVSRR
jgi:Reverse transcriptase (RNA-dependent DNA polymerase)